MWILNLTLSRLAAKDNDRRLESPPTVLPKLIPDQLITRTNLLKRWNEIEQTKENFQTRRLSEDIQPEQQLPLETVHKSTAPLSVQDYQQQDVGQYDQDMSFDETQVDEL